MLFFLKTKKRNIKCLGITRIHLEILKNKLVFWDILSLYEKNSMSHEKLLSSYTEFWYVCLFQWINDMSLSQKWSVLYNQKNSTSHFLTAKVGYTNLEVLRFTSSYWQGHFLKIPKQISILDPGMYGYIYSENVNKTGAKYIPYVATVHKSLSCLNTEFEKDSKLILFWEGLTSSHFLLCLGPSFQKNLEINIHHPLLACCANTKQGDWEDFSQRITN